MPTEKEHCYLSRVVPLLQIMVKRCYYFGGTTADGSAKLKNWLGGKGANLAEMVASGLPVPAGFTITTDTCTEYNTAPKVDHDRGATGARG